MFENRKIAKSNHSEEKLAENFVNWLKELQEFSQIALVTSNQNLEFSANKKRFTSEIYRVDDQVWLSYGHCGIDRPKKKMDWHRGKFTVSKVLDSHNVELTGLPNNIPNMFYVDQLRRAANDPLRGQKLHDEQPSPITIIEGEVEQFVEEILYARTFKRGKGARRLALVNWKGLADPSWEPLEALQDTEALDRFESSYGIAETRNSRCLR